MKFAFYGRVSTEDNQNPADSRAWQLSRSTSLIAPHDGTIVAEYFDVGFSRSTRWKDRPEGARLLADLEATPRAFDAVVIGEPARAFYGSQFAMTFPVFTRFGVALWVPEVAGPIDPGSEAHEMVMGLFAGMSKGERQRIKIRVRTAMSAQATTGRFLGGRPPYGYELVDDGPHRNPGKASAGQRAHRLAVDTTAAPIVQRIYAEYIAGAGLHTIAEGLTRDGIPSPSAHDPDRNRHRASSGGAWSKAAIRTILRNPRYTGREVWGRQRRDEDGQRLDVDVVFGHEAKMRWNDRADWIWANESTHDAIVDTATFARAQEIAAASARQTPMAKRPTPRPYALRGLIFCSVCGRRMQGTWNHDRAHYRCTFPATYAEVAGREHPGRAIYVREDRIVPKVDAWLMETFTEANLEQLVAAAATGIGNDAIAARAEAARRTLADCDRRLTKYRAALDAGADPAIVAAWMGEVSGDRERALFDLRETSAEGVSIDDARAMVASVAEVVRLLEVADAADKTALYAAFGLRLDYDPVTRKVLVDAAPPRVPGSVSEGGLEHMFDRCPQVRLRPCLSWSEALFGRSSCCSVPPNPARSGTFR